MFVDVTRLDIVHMVAGLTKNAIFRLTKDNLQFIIKERVVFGGVSAWCEVDHVALFPERTCEGVSAQQDEIFLEVVLDQLTHCLRSGSASASASGTSFATSVSAPAGAGGVASTSIVGYATFGQGHGSAPSVHGLKIKLVRRSTPCLAIELEQAFSFGRPNISDTPRCQVDGLFYTRHCDQFFILVIVRERAVPLANEMRYSII
ncbi:unnamed protein product [Echinostoma caproni]|uniref:IRS-type PTB domain-containing protein n=1 Tax=Echinostoma caproni TaxID=27848 RepID=A0A183B6A2_9TREM|nr:unnamed protein product [Echinostoma caproni]